MATRGEMKQAVGERYRAAGRWGRQQLFDEFTRVTGYHRKHALRLLNRPFVPRPSRARPGSTIRRCVRRGRACRKRRWVSISGGGQNWRRS